MSSKYKISQGTVVYGNYPGKSAEEAVLKAYDKVGDYYNFDFSSPFEVKHGSKVSSVSVGVPNEE